MKNQYPAGVAKRAEVSIPKMSDRGSLFSLSDQARLFALFALWTPSSDWLNLPMWEGQAICSDHSTN